MKAKIIHMNAVPKKNGRKEKKLSKSKITSLIKKISQGYKDGDSKDYFNYPGFQRG